MKGSIMEMEYFPVTVMDAVAVGDKTSSMLKDYLRDNYVSKTQIGTDFTETADNLVEAKTIYAALKPFIEVGVGNPGQVLSVAEDGALAWIDLPTE